MALKQHKDLNEMIRQQRENSRQYVLPFIEKTLRIEKGVNVLEIGCGEGGVLKPFADKGAYCVGVDLDNIRIVNANIFFEQEVKEDKMLFTNQNIFNEDFQEKYFNFFDLIILKDVIEHVHEQEKFIPFMKNTLKEKGQIFFGFPPWYMPFGGHQQLLQHKWASKIPYYHLLPMPIYKAIIKAVGETPNKVLEMEEIKQTGISIERFERIVKQSHYKIVNKQWFLINPIYEFKFGLKPRKQNWLFGAVPFLRNFLTTCAYYTIQK